MKKQIFVIISKGLLLKQIKPTFLERESPTLSSLFLVFWGEAC